MSKNRFLFFYNYTVGTISSPDSILDVPIFYHTRLSAQVRVIGLLSLLFGLFYDFF